MQIGAGTVERSMELRQKIKTEAALWPSDSNSGNIAEQTHNTNSKEHMHPYVQWSFIYEQPRFGSSPSAHQ